MPKNVDFSQDSPTLFTPIPRTCFPRHPMARRIRMAESNPLENIKKEVVKEKTESLAKVAAIPDKSDPDPSSASSDDSSGAGPAPAESSKESGGFGLKLGDMAERMSQSTGEQPKGNPGQVQKGASESPANTETKPEDTKKQINDAVKKKVDSKFKDIQENLKGLEKISGLEGKITQLSERLNSQMFQPPQQARPTPGGSAISRELASFGEEVDFQTELYETKRTIASIAKSLDTLNKKMEYRISILEDRSKALERIPDLEDKFQDILQKLGPENVQKLRKLIFSSDEIVDEVIPDLVNKKIRSKVDPAMNELRDMQETINDFNSRLSHIKEEVLNLEKLRDDIQELKADKDNLYKVIDEESSRENEKLDILKQNVRRKVENVVDSFKQEIRDIKKAQSDSIKNQVSTSFLELIEPRFADLEKKDEIFDDRIKRMSKVEADLDRKISSIEAPENIKKWLESRMEKLEHGLVSEISSLEKESFDNSAGIAKNIEDIKDFRTAMKDVPKRLGNQGNMINKLLDTKDFFVSRAEQLGAEVNGLQEKLGVLQSGYSTLEERIAGQESRFLDSLNKQRDYLTASKDDLSRHVSGEIDQVRKQVFKELSGMKADIKQATKEIGKTTLAEFKAEIKRLSSAEEEIKAMRRAQDQAMTRVQKQVSDLQAGLSGANPEIKALSSRIIELDSAYKELSKGLVEASEFHKDSDSVVRTELTKYVDASISAMHRSVGTMVADEKKALLENLRVELMRISDSEEAIKALKKDQDQAARALESQITDIRGALPQIKLLGSRTAGLEEDLKGLSAQLLKSREDRKDSDSSLREELKSHVESELESLRKDIDEGRSMQIKAVVAELSAELKKITDVEESLASLGKLQQGSTEKLRKEISDIQAHLQSDEPEIRSLAKRLSEAESMLTAHSKDLISVSEARKSSDSAVKDDLRRYVDASMKVLRRDIDERRSEDIKASFSQFKEELKRLESLNQELSSFKRVQEARTDELAEGLAGMNGPVADLRSLIKKAGDLEKTVANLDKRLDAEKDVKSEGLNDLENRINLIEKGLGNLIKNQGELDQRVTQDNERLQRSLGEVISDKKSLEQGLLSQRQKMSELIKELRNL